MPKVECRTHIHRRTDNLIARLLHMTWITAAFPMVASLLNLILYPTLAPSGNSTFIACVHHGMAASFGLTRLSAWSISFNLIMPKLYSLSQMYTLNSRRSLTSGEPSEQFSMGASRVGAAANSDTLRFTDGLKGSVNTTTSIKFAVPTSHEVRELPQQSASV